MDTKMSMDNLLRAICEKQNPTVAGLDPKLDYVPQYIKDKAFNLSLIHISEPTRH